MTDCRHFNGYKPCAQSTSCQGSCPSYNKVQSSILIVHLGALGAVVRSTSLLKSIKRKFPQSMITWVTDAPAHHLLKNHPGIDRVLCTNESDLLVLSALEFDVAFVVDKSLKAAAVLKKTQADLVYGFKADPRTGAILPATEAATELWQLGLDNHKKFHVNEKAETQLMIEAFELGPYQRDDYWLPLTADEALRAQDRKASFQSHKQQMILGFNTGCSNVIAAKRWTVDFHRRVIQAVQKRFPELRIVLLGGPEDHERNLQIAEGLNVINSDAQSGLRDGLISIAACDVVVTGDSLGMHMAISQKKEVVAWFGPTCAQEIDLYERGVKLLSRSPCAPCWKRSCEKDIMCYDQVSLEDILNAIESCCANSLSRRPAALHSLAEEMQGTVATT